MNEADQDQSATVEGIRNNIQSAAKKRSEYKLRWYLQNRDKCLAKRRETYASGKGVAKEVGKIYRDKNREKISEYKKDYAMKNREILLMKKKDQYLKNKEAHLRTCKEYREKNKSACNERSKIYREKNRKRFLLVQKEYREKNKESRNIRYKTDSQYRLASLIRNRLRGAMRSQQCRKNSKTMEILGCSIDEFKIYIQSQFSKGMSWNNQGKVWHIDHIIPLSSFDLSNDNQLRQSCHWSNMRPLKAKDNLKKSDKITEPQMSLLLPV